MTEINLDGVFTALVTPFKNGEVDYISLKRLITHQLDHGIQGLVVSGSTGEAATLNLDEKIKILKFTLSEVSKKVPVVIGSGTFNTRETAELVEAFDKFNPDAFLLVSPYYNKPPQRGLLQHYLEVAKKSLRPMILYNVPGRTACALAVPTTVSLASQAKNIIAIKEAAGDLNIIKELREKCPSNFQVTSGDDPTFLKAMTLGACGVISVVSHVIPKLCVEHARAVREKPAKASALSDEISDISNAIFCESNPIPVKWALREMGVIGSQEVRLPLMKLEESFHKSLRESLQKIGAL